MSTLSLSDEMVERAARALDRAYDRHELTLQGVARDVLAAAFEEVPLTNYGIGLALQFFDLVICVKDNSETRATSVAAGVYRVGDKPDSFDALGHTLDVSWGHKPTRHLRRVAVGQIDPPPAGDEPGSVAA